MSEASAAAIDAATETPAIPYAKRRRAHTVANAAKELNVGESTIWKLIRERRIKSIKLFDRRLIPDTELERIVSEAA